jgi:hypothetical protein
LTCACCGLPPSRACARAATARAPSHCPPV